MVEDKLIREAVFLRGLFVYRHSGIEYSINELLVRARLLEEYQAIGNLPFKFESRLKQLEKMMKMPGRLNGFCDTFTEAVACYRDYTVYRHFMVHGLMALPERDAEDQRIRFRAYSHRPGSLHLGRLDMTLKEMRTLAGDLFSISGIIPPLVARIIKEVPLPQVEEGEPTIERERPKAPHR